MRASILALAVVGCFLVWDVQAARLFRRDVQEETPEPELSCEDGQSGRFVIPGNCTHYLSCSPRGARIRKCPDGLHFDRRRWCTSPEKAACPPEERAPVSVPARCPQDLGTLALQGDENVPICPGIPESDPEPEIECPRFWGTFAFPGDCTKYFVCDENVPSIRQCPENQFFFQGTGCMMADACSEPPGNDILVNTDK